jgi:antitoxin HigA-1
MREEITKVGMRPSHPGEFIRKEILAELGLTVARAAEILGVRRGALSDLVNGHAAISPEMALRIEKAFGVNMDMLRGCRRGSTPTPCGSGPVKLTLSRSIRKGRGKYNLSLSASSTRSTTNAMA